MAKRVKLGPDYERPRVQRKAVAASAEAGEKATASHARTHGRAQRASGGRSPPAAPRAHEGAAASPAPGEEKKEDPVSSALGLAASMTSAQRKELLDQLALQNHLAAKAAANPDLEMWAQAVREALGESIGLGGGESYGVMLLKRLLGSPSCWRPVEQFMRSSRLGELQRTARFGVYLMLSRLLVAECKDLAAHVGAPLSAKFVAQRTGDLAGVFERSFPGYLAAGLAPVVARQMASA